MAPARAVLLVANLALAALVAATFGSGLGGPRWHHDVGYAALVLAALGAVPLMRRRRVTTLTMASLAAWSTFTGLGLVYVMPEVRHGRWMGWWHGMTSAGFFLAFLAHWARNNPRLVGLVRQLARRPRPLAATLGAWALLGLVAWASWRTPLGEAFTDRWFQHLATLSFGWAAAGVACAALLVTSSRDARPVAERTRARNRVRGAVDASLLGATWLTTLTGFPLLYFTRELRAADAYWLVASWHVIGSALLLALVAAHAGFNRRPLAAHAR